MSVFSNSDPQLSQENTRKISVRCLTALAILSILATVNFIILSQQIQTSRYDGEMIRIAAQQRILFERASLLSRYFVSAPDDRDKDDTREQLLDAIYELERASDTLLNGNRHIGIPHNTHPEILSIYKSAPYFLEQRMARYLIALKELPLTRNQAVSPND